MPFIQSAKRMLCATTLLVLLASCWGIASANAVTDDVPNVPALQAAAATASDTAPDDAVDAYADLCDLINPMVSVSVAQTLTLSVQSDPVGVRIESPTCHSGTTNYTKTMAPGTNVILEAPEFIGEGASRMRFVRWSGCTVSIDPTIGFQVNANCTVKAWYEASPIHTLTVESDPVGVRIESPTCQSGTTNCSVTVAHGANVILEAPEFIGEGASLMQFVRWTGCKVSTNRIIGFQVNADCTVKAWYEAAALIHTLTVESDPVGVRIESPTCQSGTTNYSVTVAHGANVILEAPEFIGEGASRMHFVRWTGCTVSTNRIIGFQVNADCTVKAWYEASPIHTLTVESDPVGVRIESPTCQSGITNYTKTVAHGANVILEAPEFIGEGDTLMHFVRWTGCVVSTNRIISFQVNANCTVKAWYEASPIHTLTVESDPIGVRIESPTCQSGTTNYSVTVAHGANVILEAPEFIGEGASLMQFVRWTGCKVSTNRIIGFQVNADCTVKAWYEAAALIHTLTVESDPVGVRIESPTCQSGTTNYSVTVAHGANVILEAPEFIGEGDSRMHFVRWTGCVVSTNPIIGFQVNADCTVKAWYEASPIHTVTVESDVSVRIESPTCQSGTTDYNSTVAHGTNVILEAPEFIGEGQERLRFERWSGYVTSTERIISFQVNADVALTVHYVAAPTSPLLVYALQERGYKFNGSRTTINRRGALVMDVASGNAALLFVSADGTATLENWDQEPGSWYTIDAPARAYWMLTNGAVTVSATSQDARHHHAEVIGALLQTPVSIGGGKSISLATSLQGIRRAGTSGTSGTLEQTTIDARLVQALTVELNNQGLSHAEGIAEVALRLHVDLSAIAPSQTAETLPTAAAAAAPFGATSVIAYRLNHKRLMVGDGQLDSFSSGGFLLIDPVTSRMQAILAWRTANTWRYTVETWCDSFTFSSTVQSGNQAVAVFGARQATDEGDLTTAAGHFQYRLISGVVKQVRLNGEQVSLPLQLNGAAWQHHGNHGDHGRQTFTANASPDTVRFANEQLSMEEAIDWLITNRLPAGAMQAPLR